MKELMELLPLLNLLVVPVFMAYVKHEVRLAKLEEHRANCEEHFKECKPVNG